MKSLKRLWMPVLLGVVLMSILVGVARARPNARPHQQAWRLLAVTPHACVPDEESTNYNFWSDRLDCEGPPCRFYCAIDFPAAGEQAVGAVQVKRVTMFAFDNTGGAMVEVWLRKTYGPTGGFQTMAYASTGDSAAIPQAAMDTSIVSNPIYRTQAPYMDVRMGATFMLYGLHIHYTW
jgi:hypothetical protein